MAGPMEGGDIPPITYPLIEEPSVGTGEATEIAPGILWIRMPLEGALGSINIWALREEDGWSIVDTGMRDAPTVAAWRLTMERSLGGKPIKRVFVTHMHPDHSGMVGWLTERFGARLWMTPLEYFTLHMLSHDTGRSAPEEAIAFYRAAGMHEDWLDDYRARFGEFGKKLYPLPVQFRALRGGDQIRIGSYDWTCLIGRGHSPEHACLHSPELKLLIAGDQILPTISPNVSVQPYEPEADPLTLWLASLNAIRTAIPDDVLVLPAHGRPFQGLHARIAKIISGHEAGLERLLTQLEAPHRASEVFTSLFRAVGADPFVQMMAIGESLAHLACLRTRGQVEAICGNDGITLWQRNPTRELDPAEE